MVKDYGHQGWEDDFASEIEKWSRVRKELITSDTPEKLSGCPNCNSERVEWAELMNGTFWKQCGACGMIYVGQDVAEQEIDE